MDRIISYLGVLWLFVLATLANWLPESVESLSQYHMPRDVRDLPRTKQHFICTKKEKLSFTSCFQWEFCITQGVRRCSVSFDVQFLSFFLNFFVSLFKNAWTICLKKNYSLFCLALCFNCCVYYLKFRNKKCQHTIQLHCLSNCLYQPFSGVEHE